MKSSPKSALERRILAALLFALAACRAAPPPQATAPPDAAPAADAVALRNRDPRGNPDVERYIRMLEAPERLAELRIPDVVAALGLPRDAVVADVGCGPGAFAVAFAAACPDGVVYAADVEPRQLDELRAKLLAGGIGNVVPVLASFSDPHLPSGRMDLVLVCDTYHHLEERVAWLRALAGDLAPGGRLVLLEYKPGDIPVGPPADHKLPAGVRERELAEAGFELERSIALHVWHDFEVWRPVRVR